MANNIFNDTTKYTEVYFFDQVRKSLFKGKLTQGVVDTINAITEEYFKHGNDLRELAYILATAYHESYSPKRNPQWFPPREGFTETNKGAINAVTSLYERGIINNNYALPDREGKSWYGRGFVQCTFKNNYERLGKRIGVDLTTDPDRALDRGVAAKLLVIGSLEGLYTGRKLSDYITPTETNFKKARRVINGVDKAELISGYADKFYKALTLV